eukprot:2053805-Prymnesium_polylepis.1
MHVGVPEIEPGTAGCVQSFGVIRSVRISRLFGARHTCDRWRFSRAGRGGDGDGGGCQGSQSSQSGQS